MIDWTKPLEAVHTDGRVVAAIFDKIDLDGDYRVAIDGFGTWFANKSGDVPLTKWRIRNVQTVRTSDEALRRMEALVRRMATCPKDQYVSAASVEAKAIVALLEPVDPDIAIAMQICNHSPYDLDGPAVVTNGHIHEAVLAGIKYGRAQQ